MDHFEQLRKEKEIIKLRESMQSDWRSEMITEKKEDDHPYIEVMPSGEVAPTKEKKEKKEEKKEEEVKESVQDDAEHQKNFKAAADAVAKGMAGRRKLDLTSNKKRKGK